jgi:hypothetical protein
VAPSQTQLDNQKTTLHGRRIPGGMHDAVETPTAEPELSGYSWKFQSAAAAQGIQPVHAYKITMFCPCAGTADSEAKAKELEPRPALEAAFLLPIPVTYRILPIRRRLAVPWALPTSCPTPGRPAARGESWPGIKTISALCIYTSYDIVCVCVCVCVCARARARACVRACVRA